MMLFTVGTVKKVAGYHKCKLHVPWQKISFYLALGSLQYSLVVPDSGLNARARLIRNGYFLETPSTPRRQVDLPTQQLCNWSVLAAALSELALICARNSCNVFNNKKMFCSSNKNRNRICLTKKIFVKELVSLARPLLCGSRWTETNCKQSWEH